jgi:hypothetical protein
MLSHDDGNIELGVTGYKINVKMSQHNKHYLGASFLGFLSKNFDVKRRVNDKSLSLRLNIIRKSVKMFESKLGNVVSISFKLITDLNLMNHLDNKSIE